MSKASSTHQQNLDWLHAECPFSVTLSALGSRWRAPILWKLLHGAQTFGDLSRALPIISEKMLAQGLGELAELGLIDKLLRSEQPLRVEYQPSPLGASLEPILAGMFTWGEQQQRRPGPPLAAEQRSALP
jgi:DNA-binding HxlR family transcriptional regulator